MEMTLSATSLIPSILAVILALTTRQVFVSMYVGIWAGAWLIDGAGLDTLLPSMFSAIDTYVIGAIVPDDGSNEHFSIVLFSLMTGAMIGILSHNGGMRGIVDYFSTIANTRRKGQSATFVLGWTVFFDDYANTLIVGNTMRPLTDSLKISRQKLAFLVDSTAAPIACIAILTTWVGFQASLMEDSLKHVSLGDVSGFGLVVAAIPYSFYPLLMLWFIFVLILTGRDFGPMYRAEKRAIAGEVATDKGTLASEDDEIITHLAKPQLWNAVLPIAVYIIGTFWGMIKTGEGESLREILGDADPFKAILWGATAGLFTAICMSLLTRRLSMAQTMNALEAGLRPMILAAMILTFAWAIADVNTELRTADYIVSVVSGVVSPLWLPVLVFLIAAATSFATGSSWSTMGILVPLVLPLSYNILHNEGITDIVAHPIMLASIASVLTGAVWGDHCSPISDTTILSSMASGCDHVEHVRTQMPYAMVVASVSMLCCLIPVGIGIPWWAGLIIGATSVYVLIRLIGRKLD